MPKITPHNRIVIVRDPDLVTTQRDGDVVMMSNERGLYFGVSGVGARVWELWQEPVSVIGMAQAILAEYDIDEATCQSDLLTFPRGLVDNGVARLC